MGLRKLDTTGMWKVNDSPIYVPDTDVGIEYHSLASEDSGRDESGYMHIVWVRTDLRKVKLKYALMTGEELAYMRNLMQGKEFLFTYADENKASTFQAYTSKIDATLYTKIGDVLIYKDVSINAIEK